MPSCERVFEVQVTWARLKPEEFIWTPCILCGSPHYEPLASLVINWIEFFIVQCSKCRLKGATLCLTRCFSTIFTPRSTTT